MVSPLLERLGLAKQFALAAVVAVAGSACDWNVSVTGVVRDPTGAPIQDVVVELETAERGPHRAKTASDGSYQVNFIGADPRSLSISFRKDGYQDVRRIVGEDADPTINVTLVPLRVP